MSTQKSDETHTSGAAQRPIDREKVARAIHEGLGGNGWAYTNYGGDEWNDKKLDLLRAASAAIAVIAAQPPAAPVETKPFSAKENLREVIAEVRADIDAAESAVNWPPLKMALWRVLMDERLNDGHYIKAFDLIEKLYAAAQPHEHSSAESCELRWQTASEKDCCDALYQIGGALRRVGKSDLAQDAEKIAAALYPGDIKPAPIVPRTTT